MRLVILALSLSLALLATTLMVAQPPAAYAADIAVVSCPTILNSLYQDWQATQDLIALHGSSAELNPVVRAVGPDTYFAVWTFGMAGLCRENQQWQYISLVVWLIQTWAVNTHYSTGTVHGIPLLMMQIDLGSGSPEPRE